MFSLPVPLTRSVKPIMTFAKGATRARSFGSPRTSQAAILGGTRLRTSILTWITLRSIERRAGALALVKPTLRKHVKGYGSGSRRSISLFRVVPPGPQSTHGRWAVDRNSPNLHVIFGWLQIGEVIWGRLAEIGAATLLAQKPWLRDHPHPLRRERPPKHDLHHIRTLVSTRGRRDRACGRGRAELVPSPPAAHRRRGGSTISLVAPILVPAERNRFTHLQFQARTLVPNR